MSYVTRARRQARGEETPPGGRANHVQTYVRHTEGRRFGRKTLALTQPRGSHGGHAPHPGERRGVYVADQTWRLASPAVIVAKIMGTTARGLPAPCSSPGPSTTRNGMAVAATETAMARGPPLRPPAR